MSYLDQGYNEFFERSIATTPAATNLNSLPNQTSAFLNLDRMQSLGKLGGTMQLSGDIKGGKIKDMELGGDLSLAGLLTVGDRAIQLEGRKTLMTIFDSNQIPRIYLGKRSSGFGIEIKSSSNTTLMQIDDTEQKISTADGRTRLDLKNNYLIVSDGTNDRVIVGAFT